MVMHTLCDMGSLELAPYIEINTNSMDYLAITLILLTKYTVTLVTMTIMSAQETTSGQISSTAFFISSMSS